MVYADAAVSLNASESIFGATGQAEFVIWNLGGQLTIGLGPGYSIANAILAPLSTGNGAVQTAGYVQTMEFAPGAISGTAVPEPAVLGVTAAGAALLFWLRRRLSPR